MTSTFSSPVTCLTEVLFKQTELPKFIEKTISKEEFFQRIKHPRENYFANQSYFFHGQVVMTPIHEVKTFVHTDVREHILDNTAEAVIVRDYIDLSAKFQTERIGSIFTQQELLFITENILPVINKDFEFTQGMTFGDKKYRVLLHFYHSEDKRDVKEAVIKIRKIHLLKFFQWIRENE